MLFFITKLRFYTQLTHWQNWRPLGPRDTLIPVYLLLLSWVWSRTCWPVLHTALIFSPCPFVSTDCWPFGLVLVSSDKNRLQVFRHHRVSLDLLVRPPTPVPPSSHAHKCSPFIIIRFTALLAPEYTCDHLRDCQRALQSPWSVCYLTVCLFRSFFSLHRTKTSLAMTSHI